MNQKKSLFISALFIAVAFTPASALKAQNIYLDEGNEQQSASAFVLPYVYSSDQTGFAFGLGGVHSGFLQPQGIAGWAIQGSANGSYGIYAGGVNYQIDKRWFFDPLLAVNRYTEMRSYQDIVAQFGDDRSGSNGSAEDNYVEDKGWDIFLELKTKWLLPIAQGKDEPLHTYRLNNGLLSDDTYAAGGSAFNPLSSGRTFLTFTPFYRSQEFDDDVSDMLQSSSNGVQVGLLWNNKDYDLSPSRGEEIEFTLKRDFGWFNSDDSWTTWEAEASKFISLGDTDWARQQVLALNFWTSDTPSWNESNGRITNRAPDFYSPKLGGFNRMRAFPFERFNDRSSIYYAAEYRVIPEWNPWQNIEWINNWVDIKWWQVVPFVELGRVAPEYDLGALHENMKWDAGLGVRFMAKNSIIRLDWATSEESSGLWFMFGQSF